MEQLLDLITRVWNWLVRHTQRRSNKAGLVIGHEIDEGKRTGRRVRLSTTDRTQHVITLGKTGSGKSSFLRFLCEQDIRANRGFAVLDIHGDATPAILQVVAQEERRRGEDLSEKLVVIDPADSEFAVGLNLLELPDSQLRFVQIAEAIEILKVRWKLDTFGARTEELLRNSLHVLADAGLTIVDVIPLLTKARFRSGVLASNRNSESARYFFERFDLLSSPMQAVYREAVLNKVSLFATDPHFADLLGQTRSTVSFTDVLETGQWLIINLDRGRLGEQAVTLGGLLLSRLKYEAFRRASRELFTLYCDELQDLVAYDVGVEVLLSESRKYGIGVMTANQFLEQYSPRMRAAVLATGTQVFFQLSARDAKYIASLLNEGTQLATRLQSLSRREALVRLTSGEITQLRVPMLTAQSVISDLYARCQRRWARKRDEVQEQISSRQSPAHFGRKDSLEGWL